MLTDSLEDPVFKVPILEVIVEEEVVTVNKAEGGEEGESTVFEAAVFHRLLLQFVFLVWITTFK